LRRAARLTQQELASQAGISRQTVVAWERGHRVSPATDDAVRRVLEPAIAQERQQEHAEALAHGLLEWETFMATAERLNRQVRDAEMYGATALQAMRELCRQLGGQTSEKA
jgi:transcriptional regulator with XRE-family HTH domain